MTGLSRSAARRTPAKDGVFYIDRETGEVCEERVFGRAFMEFFYDSGVGRLLTDTLLIESPLSTLYGWYNDSGWSRRKIRPFVRELEIPLEEVDGAVADFACFNDFFARRLKPEARPQDPDPSVLISPCDARTYVHDAIDGDTLLPVKGARVPLAELLRDGSMAERYHGGGAVVFRLCPSDYHRFHFPADGLAGPTVSISGIYHSVSPFALEKGIDIFCRNHRHVMELATERFGRIALIDVAAICVGRIRQTYSPGPVRRGDEKGYFKFGGSTTILLSEPGRVRWDADLIGNTDDGLETLVKVGTRLGVAS